MALTGNRRDNTTVARIATDFSGRVWPGDVLHLRTVDDPPRLVILIPDGREDDVVATVTNRRSLRALATRILRAVDGGAPNG